MASAYYRRVYLKSDDWKTLRAAKLSAQNFRCQICGSISPSNDVHHVKYRNLFDVEPQDLRVLCRSCHDQVHELLDRFPKMRRQPRHVIWRAVRMHLLKDYRLAHPKKERNRKASQRGSNLFGGLRKALIDAGQATKKSMPYNSVLAKSDAWKLSPTALLNFYREHVK